MKLQLQAVKRNGLSDLDDGFVSQGVLLTIWTVFPDFGGFLGNFSEKSLISA